MIKGLVRLLAFFVKEVSEVRRQPRLMLSLVLGPFLILLIFGLGYIGEQPKLKTIMVVPPGSEADPRIQSLRDNLGPNFNILDVTSDEAGARARLARSEADIVEVVPKDVDQLFGRTEQSAITVLYNEIDPLQEQWIKYLTYVQVKELNTALLVNLAGAAKEQNGNLGQYIADARQQLGTIQAGLQVAGSEQTRTAIQRLRSNNSLILASLISGWPEHQQPGPDRPAGYSGQPAGAGGRAGRQPGQGPGGAHRHDQRAAERHPGGLGAVADGAGRGAGLAAAARR